jgi:hypothetical protein
MRLSRGYQDSHGDGQVKGSPFLADRGGREVDEHAVSGEFITRIADGGPDALLGLPHRAIGQAHDVDPGYAAADIDLDRDEFPGKSRTSERDNGHAGLRQSYRLLRRRRFKLGAAENTRGRPYLLRFLMIMTMKARE